MLEAKYKLTVGLEIHAELKTKTKMFCACKNDPEDDRPNVNVCPICMAHPGTLPVINKQAVKNVLKVGLALNGKLADFTEFDRKNYFYPDIPKGYQISQYKFPLVSGGTLKGVEITRVHLEEDTASSLHTETRIDADNKNRGLTRMAETRMNADSASVIIGDDQRENPRESASLIDFNRAGVPLMELVTEPVIHTAEQAGDFARELQLVLQYLGVSDANMEKGEMRVEANISVATEIADGRGSTETRMDADADEDANKRGLKTRINADNKNRGSTRMAETRMDTDTDRDAESTSSLIRDDQREDPRESASLGKLLYEDLSYKIRGAIFNVRNALGSGHKESIYQNALEKEFEKAGIKFEKEKVINVVYEDKPVGVYRPDFVLDEKVILELKALPFIGKKEKEQLWHYLKGSSYRLAIIANFGSNEIQIERIVFDSARPSLSASISDSNPRQSASLLGTKCEVKNLNSFRAVERAIEYEYQRQVALLEAGEKVVQETRGWDDSKQKTFSQRKKEDSHDYRYFPDPDLPKLKISELSEFAEKELRKEMSELPEEKRGRYAKDYGIKEEDIEVFINSKLLSEMFDKFVAPKLKGDKNLIKIASNYITNDLKKLIEGRHEKIEIIQENFYELPIMIGAGEISSRGAKDILAEFVEKGGSPKVIAKEKNLIQKSDENELQKVVEEIIKNNPKVVQDFKGGKEASLQFLVGQGMKATKGAGNPEVIKKMLKEKIREN